MPAGEKEILQCFKQDASPLFTVGEMQKIYALVLQAGMENGLGEKELHSILRKAECVLAEGMRGNRYKEAQQVREMETLQEEGEWAEIK